MQIAMSWVIVPVPLISPRLDTLVLISILAPLMLASVPSAATLPAFYQSQRREAPMSRIGSRTAILRWTRGTLVQ
jgi:hypothetical protein